jgi:dihydropteroate synthase
MQLLARGRVLDLTAPKVMGVLNLTPDSFSDGGRFIAVNAAVDHALTLIEQGATLIDLGGESTRPGAAPVCESEELDRVMPVVEELLVQTTAWISVDTSKTAVMSAVIAAGVHLINDVNALQAPGAVTLLAAAQLPVCLMHRQGLPPTMQQSPTYHDVVTEVSTFLAQRLWACEQAGIQRNQCLIDPGFGFGKTLAHNLLLMRNLSALQKLNAPLLIGVSRKSMIGQVLNRPLDQRLYGGLALAVWSVLQGAQLIRTHDVLATVDALKMLNAVLSEED